MSNRIAQAFANAKAQNRAAFIPFIMGGDPTMEACEKLLFSLPDAGADIVELGIPFSDPMADGPTIQAAGLRALHSGATLEKILILAEKFRTAHPNIPLVLMGYLNPIYCYGYAQFAEHAAKSGVDGIILVDLPPEEAAEIEPLLSAKNIALVRLIAPTSIPDRLPLLTQHAQGYLYLVSITGITGAGSATEASIAEYVAQIRNVTSLPIAVGFGIKTRAHVEAMGKLADGVVVGSAIVAQHAESPQETPAFIRALAGV